MTARMSTPGLTASGRRDLLGERHGVGDRGDLAHVPLHRGVEGLLEQVDRAGHGHHEQDQGDEHPRRRGATATAGGSCALTMWRSDSGVVGRTSIVVMFFSGTRGRRGSAGGLNPLDLLRREDGGEEPLLGTASASRRNTTTPTAGILGRNRTNRRATSRCSSSARAFSPRDSQAADSTATTPWATTMPSVAAAPPVWWSAAWRHGSQGEEVVHAVLEQEGEGEQDRPGHAGAGPARTRRIRSRTSPPPRAAGGRGAPGEHVHGERREHADDGEDRRACDANPGPPMSTTAMPQKRSERQGLKRSQPRYATQAPAVRLPAHQPIGDH